MYVQPNQFPWVVGVYVVLNAQSKVFKCSGALISNKHVLSSVYCKSIQVFWAWYQIEVRLGINTPSAMTRVVSRVYTHENYNKDNLDFNIAIWQLDEKVPFGFNIQPICLPSSSLIEYDGKLATAAGWYLNDRIRVLYVPTSMASFVSTSKLHQIHIPIWTNEKCAELSNYPDRLTNNTICAGEYENGVRRACMEDVRLFERNIYQQLFNFQLFFAF